MENIISFENLEIQMQNNIEIHYGSFDIKYGDFIIIQGDNGCGKSTFLKTFFRMSNYFTISKNSKIFIFNRNLFDYKDGELQRKIVNIMQNNVFKNKETVYDALIRPSMIAISDFKNKKEYREKIKKIADDYFVKYLSKFDNNFSSNKNLEELKSKRVDKLSGGESRILYILQGLLKAEVIESDLIFMDEPVNNLDEQAQKKLFEIMEDRRKKNPKTTFIIITHQKVFKKYNVLMSFVKSKEKVYCNFERIL